MSMDFFKFESAGEPTTLDQGEQINGITNSMWVERYAEPGEFSFEAPLSTGLLEFLPIGTLISHADTLEIMIVENHEIKEEEDKDSTLKITGRSFISYLENRIVGVNLARSSSTLSPYILLANDLSIQIPQVINDHIYNPLNTNDALTDVVANSASIGTTESFERTIDRGTVLQRVIELLNLYDLGIRTIRKNTFPGGSTSTTIINVHKGIDKSASVFFSWKAGDLSSASYLFSNKLDKNSALVYGRYVWIMVDTSPTKYARRIMVVDASDLDDYLTDPPTGGTLTLILNAMTVRGNQALRNQNYLTITQSDISDTTQYAYRRDYNVGDLVSIDGNFGQIVVMRVVEYAEIEDENGESGHPTLALPWG